MLEAWKILDLEYGDIEEVRAKLKKEIKSIKIKATSAPARILEVFNQVQLISPRLERVVQPSSWRIRNTSP